MSSNTTNLGLLKADPLSDGDNTFNIKTMLNDNWDKIDAAVIAKLLESKGYTDNKIQTLLSNAPGALDTLKELADALGDDPNFSTTITNYITSINASLSDMMYQVAGGTGTALTLTINGTLKTGYPITFIVSANNGGAATTINGKKLFKPATTTAPNLIVGKAYTVWYNSTGDSGNGCFFLKASAEGNVLASQVLKDKTFSNDTDTGLIGTLDLALLISSNIRAGITINGITGATNVVDTTISSNVATSAMIRAGYKCCVNGATITGTATEKAVATITPGTTDQTIASGVITTGVQTIKGDANLIPANIPKGISMFGVAGSAIVASLYSGIVPSFLYNATTMPLSGYFRCSIAVGNYIYCILNANLLYRYDTVNNVWTQLATCSGTGNTAGLCSNGSKLFYCISGITTFYIYDIASNTWSTGANMTSLNLPSCVYNGGYVYVLSDAKIIYIYNVSTNTWSSGSAYAGPARRFAGMVVYNGYIYYACGDGTSTSNALDIYNISTNTWTVGSSYVASGGTQINSKYGITAEVYNGHVYIFGGKAGTSIGVDVDCYNIATGYWDIMCAKLPTGINNTAGGSMGSGIVNNFIYVIVSNGNTANNHWVFNAI